MSLCVCDFVRDFVRDCGLCFGSGEVKSLVSLVLQHQPQHLLDFRHIAAQEGIVVTDFSLDEI